MENKYQLYEYCCIYSPTTKQMDNDASLRPAIAVPVTTVLEKTIEAVKVLAARAIPDEYLDKLSEVSIYIRPF